MIASTRKLIFALFGKKSLEEVSVMELQQLIEQYPSFQAGHYLLSKKLQQEGSEEFLQETQRTALYFNNPFWLQWLLQHSTPLSQHAAAPLAEDLSGQETRISLSQEPNQGHEHFWAPAPETLIPEESSFKQTVLVSEEVELDQVDSQAYQLPSHLDAELGNGSSVAEDTLEVLGTFPESDSEVASASIVELQTNAPMSDGNSSPDLPSEILENEPEPVPGQTEAWTPPSSLLDEAANSFQEPEALAQDTPPAPEPAPARRKYFWEEPQDKEPSSELSMDQASEASTGTEHVNTSDLWISGAVGKGKYFWQTEEDIPVIQEPPVAEPAPVAPEVEVDQPPAAEETALHPTQAAQGETQSLEPQLAESTPSVFEQPGMADQPPLTQETTLHPTEISHRETRALEPELVDSTPGVFEQPSMADQLPLTEENTLHPTEVAHVETRALEPELVDSTPGVFEQPGMADQPMAELDPTIIQPPGLTLGPEPSQTEPLLIEPYHTIDYFASQGIRFVPEENPTDRFGKQLKSFTDWLKVMKKLPVPRSGTEPDEADDTSIQLIAAYSNEEKDIVTETMAEVLAKQGRNEKAIELYHKLSLLIPAKSAYFAAKIDKLKNPLT
jgi:hypothetical protein